MPGAKSFFEAPEGTHEEMMRATYLALCAHGYADLTMQRIGERFPKSKSLIYHHYEGKDDLLLDFLGFMLEQFEEAVPFEDADGADDHLEAVLDHVFATPLPEQRSEFTRAMVEFRAQAAHDAAYREQFARHDQFFRERLASIIEAGIEEGVFRAVDVEAVASFLVTVVTGTMTQRVTTTDGDLAAVREEVDRYVRTLLEADSG